MIELFPYARVYTDICDVIEREIKKRTGARSVQLKILDDLSFEFEDIENVSNRYMGSVIGVVDPQSDINIYEYSSSHINYIVDEDDTNDRLLVIATDSLERGLTDIIRNTIDLVLGDRS